MTGVLKSAANVVSSAMFASSRGSGRFEQALFFVLGAITYLAFWTGAYFHKLGWRPLLALQPSNENNLRGVCLKKNLVVVVTALCNNLDAVKKLEQCIAAIDRQFTVVLVDDGSSKSLKELSKVENVLLVRHSVNRGAAAGRNTGVAVAMEIGATAIAFTDADCVPSHDWPFVMETLQKKKPGAYAGITKSADSASVVGRYHDAVGTLSPRVLCKAQDKTLYAPTANLCVSVTLLKQTLFDERFPTSAFEDCDFCIRLRRNIVVARNAIVMHQYDMSLTGLLKQYHKYGQSEPLMCQKHPGYEQRLAETFPLSCQKIK